MKDKAAAQNRQRPNRQRKPPLFFWPALLGAAVFAAANSRADDFEAAARAFFCHGGPRAFAGLAPAAEEPPAVQEASRAVWMLSAPNSSGSAFFLSPRILVTNFHVAEAILESSRLSDIVLSQNGVPSGAKIKKLVSISVIEDTAFFETDREAPFYLKLREGAPSKNEALFALGYPQGGFRILRKKGPLNSFGSDMKFPVAPENLLGLSGGPAVDAEGNVSGIFHTYQGNFALFTVSEHLKSALEGKSGVRCGGAWQDALESSASPLEKCLDEALRRAEAAAAEGDAEAQFKWAYRHYIRAFEAAAPRGFVEKLDSEKEIVFWLAKSAEQGYAPAQHRLGYMYLHGEGAPQDFKKGVFWLDKAVKQDYAPAEFTMGSMYLKGEGGAPQDSEKAAFWLAKAAEQGDAAAQYNLGRMYLLGHGSAERDFERAAFWLDKGAELGDPAAQHDLGLMNLYGDGLERSPEKAVFWLAKAAERGWFPALDFLFVKSGLLSSAAGGERLCSG